MKDFLEGAFFFAAAAILWGKIGISILAIIVLLILCNRIRKIITRALLLRREAPDAS